VGAGSGRPKSSNSVKAFFEDRAKKLAEKGNAPVRDNDDDDSDDEEEGNNR